jgi:hypothetical protein
MNEAPTFRTKTGYCHILPDRIVLTRFGITGEVAQAVTGNRIERYLIIYAAAAVIFCFFAMRSYKEGDTTRTIIGAVVSGLFAWGVLSSMNNSATPVIMRNKIKEIKFKRGITGITRTRFLVYFTDENNRLKYRLILLPGSLSGGSAETAKALEVMQAEKLIV